MQPRAQPRPGRFAASETTDVFGSRSTAALGLTRERSIRAAQTNKPGPADAPSIPGVRLTYHRDSDQAFVELIEHWRTSEGGSSRDVTRVTGDAVIEANLYFSDDDILRAIGFKSASRWLSSALLASAERFVPSDQ